MVRARDFLPIFRNDMNFKWKLANGMTPTAANSGDQVCLLLQNQRNERGAITNPMDILDGFLPFVE